jgi:hypothetical protein
MLALTSPTFGGRSVELSGLWTKATEMNSVFFKILITLSLYSIIDRIDGFAYSNGTIIFPKITSAVARCQGTK